MGTHVIVGAGSVGTATALELASQGHQVKLISRSGSGPQHESIERVTADANDRDALARLTGGADAIYNCANPPYDRWPELWPPLAGSLLAAATKAEAVLVTMSNLYGYGPVDHPMTESDPLAAMGPKGRVRATMWKDALAAHKAGRVRVTEARASDYYGPGMGETSHFCRNVNSLLAGKKVYVIGSTDAPHSWTYVPDVARTLVLLGTDERAWGQPWHVPTAAPFTQCGLAARLCTLAGVRPARVAALPAAVLTVGGLFSPQLRELKETLYQFDRPFILDSSAFTTTFGTEPTPTDTALQAIIDAARSPGTTSATDK